jgi:hypothetical protein
LVSGDDDEAFLVTSHRGDEAQAGGIENGTELIACLGVGIEVTRGAQLCS